MRVRFRNPFKTKSLWHGVNYLALVPAKRLDWQEDAAADRVVVLLPRYRDFLFGRLIQPRLGPAKRFLRVPLEQRGSFLWRLVDGERTVAQLSAAYAENFPEDSGEAERRVSLYLHAMYDNGFIKYLNLVRLDTA